MTTPLAIVQARMGSRRFPGKMLADLGGHPLVYWSHRAAVEAFGAEHVVCAIPAGSANDPLAVELLRFAGQVFRWGGPESDVLGRFHACAHKYRWDPTSVIVRVTADDPFKDPDMMRRVAAGERLDVERGAEAFTLAMLDEAHARYPWQGLDGGPREHISWAIFRDEAGEYAPPPLPPPADHPWSIDTPEDLEAARAWIAGERG